MRRTSGKLPGMTRIYLRFLIVELLVIGAVGMIFRFIPDRLTAGLVAGSCFVSLGFWIFIFGIRSWRVASIERGFHRSLTFWMGCVHLFATSLPLLITRMLNSSGAFAQVDVLGLPGPVFHRVSTGVYSVLLAATVFDLVRSRFCERRQPASK